MGFLITTLIFIVVGVIASVFARICCNRGPSTNLGKGDNSTACLWREFNFCWMVFPTSSLANPLTRVPLIS
ncbi:hypothetical protein MKX01_018457 [Papaver californicum]|nr:hypothetical protein MKX01_018457 [Papaver californicum]